MVNVYNAYAIINKSILNVANDLVTLDVLKIEDKQLQIRLEETPFNISERRNRIEKDITIAYNLTQYKNKINSITLTDSDVPWLEHLINVDLSDFNLTEFGVWE